MSDDVDEKSAEDAEEDQHEYAAVEDSEALAMTKVLVGRKAKTWMCTATRPARKDSMQMSGQTQKV